MTPLHRYVCRFPAKLPWTVILVLLGVLICMAANRSQGTRDRGISGWVVVEKKKGSLDDTGVIQAAIDSVAELGGGVVFFEAGHYRHRGLTGRANVHLKGVHAANTRLDYTDSSGDGIKFREDPDNFIVSNLTLTSSGRSSGWAIRADKGVHRSVRIEKSNIVGFENGILLTNAICVSIRQCRIGHTFPSSPRGIGLQFGNGEDVGGNGVTVEDCYFSSLDKGIVTYAQTCLISRPIVELCHTGIQTHGTTTVLAPWYDQSTDQAHVSVKPNTVGGGHSGTGALLLGYGSGGAKLKFDSETERNRSLVLPERLDFGPGQDKNRPLGIQLGSVVIDGKGVVYAKEFRRLLSK